MITIKHKGFCFKVKPQRWYILMERIPDRKDIQRTIAFKGSDINLLTPPEEGFNSLLYLKRIKNKPGTHEPNFPLKKRYLFAVAHFSARGDIYSDMWEWGLSLGEIEIPYENRIQMRTSTLTEFTNEILPFLPWDYEEKMHSPAGIPGGTWNLLFDIDTDFKDHLSEIESIIEKYFPKDKELILKSTTRIT